MYHRSQKFCVSSHTRRHRAFLRLRLSTQNDSPAVVRPLPECISHNYVSMAPVAVEYNQPQAQECRYSDSVVSDPHSSVYF